MKKIFIFCFILSGYASLYSQSKIDTNKVFTIVQHPPVFPGNSNTWLSENIVYPAAAKSNNIQGTVYVNFIVERDGSVSNIKLLKGAEKSLDDEAIRVVSMMPNWTPGKQNEHTVRVSYTLPIHFALNNNEPGNAGNNSATGVNTTDNGDNKIYTMVQDQPKFYGDITYWLSENMVYPKEAKDNSLEGTVFINMVIEKDGSLTGIKVMRGVEGASILDDEAVRLVSMMPKWSPGLQNGVPVRTHYMLPVHFVLNDNSGQQNNAGSQVNNNVTNSSANTQSQSVESIDGSIIQVDEKPEFHGSLLKFLADNVHYPEELKSLRTEGTVYTSLVIETNGRISDAQITKKNYSRAEFEKEALRVLNAMPKWKPAMQNGKPVATRIYLAIPFFLDADER
jgi:TonB family protein